MVNLSVSATCNMKCSFCFAEGQMVDASTGSSPYISMETFGRHLAFLERSGMREVRLIGGEPTMHPQFTELIQRARGRHIVVFTNGLMPESALASLEDLPESECTVLVNMNATRLPDGPSAAETRRRSKAVHRLRGRALLGFTIFRVDYDLRPLLELMEKAGAQRALRLGLAQPILGGRNEYLHPKSYRAVGRTVAELATRTVPLGVRLELDCGFVRCMFSDEDVEVLRNAGTDLTPRCNPILDVGVDGTVSHCFPLAGRFDLALTSQPVAKELRQVIEDRTRPYRQAGVYRRCSRCAFRERGECAGGCLAMTIRRFRSRPLRIAVPADSDRAKAPKARAQREGVSSRVPH